jgi:hypothetical protein
VNTLAAQIPKTREQERSLFRADGRLFDAVPRLDVPPSRTVPCRSAPCASMSRPGSRRRKPDRAGYQSLRATGDDLASKPQPATHDAFASSCRISESVGRPPCAR